MLHKIVDGEMVPILDEVLEEDHILGSALKELKRYISEDGGFDEKICENVVGFLKTHVDDPRVSWDHNLFEYKILLDALEKCGLVGRTTPPEEFKQISNGILYESIRVFEGLKDDKKIEIGELKKLETFLSNFKSEYDLFENGRSGNIYRLKEGGY